MAGVPCCHEKELDRVEAHSRSGPNSGKKDKADGIKLKELIGNQEVFWRPLDREVIQQVLEAEMEEAIGAGKGGRTAKRMGYRLGSYGHVGDPSRETGARVRQDRQGRFRTEVSERYHQSEKALAAALTEIYVQGVTRNVKR
jgi:putative transposase